MGQGKESGSSRLGRGAAAGCIGTFFLVACALLWARAHPGLLELLAASVASYLLAWGLYAFLSDLPRAELQSRFLLTTFAGLACIAVFECPAFLGLVDYRVVFATEDRHGGRPGYRWDDELLWTPEPHHERRGTFTRGNIGEAFCLPRHPPQDFYVRYDQNGFRNDSDPERADIVVIGDSYVESPMLPTSALLTTVLGTLQQKVVVNLGISGFGPQQTLAVLKHYAVELHPKTAVWLFYEGNDLVDAERYDQMRDTWRGRRGKLRAAWHRSFTRNASRAVVRLLRRCVPQADPQESFGVLRTADGTETTVYFVDKPVGLTASDLERLEKVRPAIEEAYALCRERGIRFVLVFVPSAYRVYRGLPNFRPGMESLAQLKINDLPERLRALAHRISPQMEFLDLLPALRAATAEGVLTFIPDDSHWTAQGHQTVAMAIHKHLGPR